MTIDLDDSKLRVCDASVDQLFQALIRKLDDERARSLALYGTACTRSPDQVTREPAFLVGQPWSRLENFQTRVNQAIIRSSSTLRYLHNKNASIFRLPDEILAHIAFLCMSFAKCHQEYHIDMDWIPDSQRRVRKVLAISQVSSIWRRVCIDNPRLWKDIDLSWPFAAIDAFATRSRAMALSLGTHVLHRSDSIVYGEHCDKRVDFWIDFLTRNMHRVEKLDLIISVDELNIKKIWRKVGHLPAPQLRAFKLSAPMYKEQVPLANLFSDNAPHLRRLELAGVSYRQFTPKGFTSLLSLELVLNVGSHLAHLFVILENTPLLKKLSISLGGHRCARDTPMPLSSTSAQRSVLRLDSCHEVQLRSFPSDMMIEILSVVHFPVLETLCIVGGTRIVDQGVLARIASHVPQTIENLGPRVVELSFSFEDWLMSVTAYRDEFQKSRIFSFQDNIGTFSTEEKAEAIVSRITALTLIPNIKPQKLSFWFEEVEEDTEEGESTEEEVFAEEQLTKDMWKVVLATYPFVDGIHIRGTSALCHFIDALDDPDNLCPHLRTLEFQGSSVRRKRVNAMLRHRRARGLPIDQAMIYS
ncbi:hypothetical protein SISSUDRAFT_785723 [Sistotremastrum suecicum HHB10207 ss-3]|uniref:F-box domain-containing protein n=1 Tax=Sistotremastrum suecicum HHB10207 ss-3 TaxID=1314776 RepID=A0A166D3I5_9AGAM|nr:hypothetical protein SISSUDRAFT_785723 [Sistotremastrum suecicum HHB10207 ss-3]